MVTPKIRAGFLSPIAGISLGMLSVMLSSTNALSGETMEAFWGSFGERNGHIEGVFLKSETSGLFFGFDEETERGAFSSDVLWSKDGQFIFEGIAMSEDSVVPTKGEGRTLELAGGVLLESGFGNSELKFESFVKSTARIERFQLEGEMGGELYLALGEAGRNYGLLIDSAGRMLGGVFSKEEEGAEFSFVTNRGDVFVSQIDSRAALYALADGRKGVLQPSPVFSEAAPERTPIYLEEVWNAFAITSSAPADGLHFIVEGEGALSVELTCDLKVDVRETGAAPQLDATSIEISRLDENDEWQEWLSSTPVVRLKPVEGNEFELWFKARLPTSLPSGTYLVHVSNLLDFRGEVEMRAVFAPAQSISAVNGSTFYYRDSQNRSHRFGFELKGDGVVQSLVRSVGPGLDYFGVPDCAQDPRLSVYKNGLKSWKNEDWEMGVSADRMGLMGDLLGAFPLLAGSRDAALLLSLGSGSYEVDSGRNYDDPGFEIIEVYLDAR